MNIYFDEKSDAVFIRLNESKKIADSCEVEKGVVLDFDDKGEVIGIEILNVKKRIPLQQLKELKFKIA
ncbi:MAG: DUF2283 domain-containing protein [Pseudomonadota bacterium]|nr:DUF2283 domain-containing protein [Pseudomonadota bacterium]